MDLITGCRHYVQHFNREEYPVYFKRYQEVSQPFFSSLSGDRIEDEVNSLLDFLENERSRIKLRFRRAAVMEDDKLLLILFLVPAALEYGTEETAAFAGELAAEWNKRYPDSTFKAGTYREINNGFTRHFLGFELKN